MRTNELQLVTYKQAVALKEAGFDWPCTHFYVDAQEDAKTAFACYHMSALSYPPHPVNWNAWRVGGELGNTSAPTDALALKWMRDVKGHHHCSIICDSYYGNNYFRVKFYTRHTGDYSTYESAESALLDELLKLIEK